MGVPARKVDAELLTAIRDAEESGEASRPWMMAGYYLSLCQACGEFRGGDCPRFSDREFLTLLLDDGQSCSEWPAIHARG